MNEKDKKEQQNKIDTKNERKQKLTARQQFHSRRHQNSLQSAETH